MYKRQQYGLLKSRNLAQRVIDQLNLGDRLPESSTLSPIKLWLSTQFKVLNNYLTGKESESPSEAAHAESVMRAFSNALVVDPVRNSRLVKLHYNSIAVSYTHLDVYKRQSQPLMQIIGPFPLK